jgi:methylenetetrahydrofolate dehydrogenase (NADP+) / methenyltetrahydrofolate cyclohydrolase
MGSPIILDGKSLAKQIEASLSARVTNVVSKTGVRPILATILVGDDPASATYVKMKENACRRIGMDSLRIDLPKETTTDELLTQIRRLNDNTQIKGVLLQHPVPSQIDERVCFEAISIEKDVDGVTCLGFGKMTMSCFAYGSATPAGIMKLLDHYEIALEGKHAVVVGRSAILGKPMAMMLLNRNATVTICHSRTQGLQDILKTADIVVGAVGRPKFIQAEWLKPGVVIVDAGYHPGGIGDVDLEKASEKCSAYTPVPGGVGPMTIATLVCQTVEAAELSINQKNIKE